MALGFVLMLGAADLLGDLTFEGGRSIAGPFLGSLGAGAVAIATLSGLGEMAGLLVRLASGYLSDRIPRLWPLALWGYAINQLSVPSLALVFQWPLGALLLVAERMGRGTRAPPRDLMLSYAALRLGPGWTFGLHEAMDQLGAMAGPLLVALVVQLGLGYRGAFAVLLAPALACLSLLWWTRLRYPQPMAMERAEADTIDSPSPLPLRFWAYVAALALVAAGYVDFPLIAFHLHKEEVGVATPPLLYGLAMGVDALAALALGRLFDYVGLRAMALAALISAPFGPLFFLTDSPPLWALAAAQWGVGMAAQESIMRAAVVTMVPRGRRGLAFGLLNAIYGLAWFAGSALMGLLYDISLPALASLAAAAQVAAALLFMALAKGMGHARGADSPTG
jgi:predicted MFS family arabinose efflux permease